MSFTIILELSLAILTPFQADKVASNLKPDSQKSTLEQGSDKVKGAADSVAGSVQPQGEKSATQKASDAVSGSDDAGKQVSLLPPMTKRPTTVPL